MLALHKSASRVGCGARSVSSPCACMKVRTAPKSMSSTVADDTPCCSVRTNPKAFINSCSSDGDGVTVARPRRIQNRPSYANGS